MAEVITLCKISFEKSENLHVFGMVIFKCILKYVSVRLGNGNC